MSVNGPTGDFVTTTLNGAITSSATIMTIGTGLEIPASNGVLQLDYDSTKAVGSDDGPETVKYTTYSTSTGDITGMTRGYDANTSGVAHDNRASVQCGPSSMYFNIDPSWIPANETWTYASASTFTITGDKTDKYAVGDKIKLDQTTDGTKYYYITAVSYSSPNTTVTITGGSDYDFDNETVSSNYYSKSSSPVDFPQWFNYTPTYAGFSSDPTAISRFSIAGTKVTLCIRMHSAGTSNANTFTVTAPVTSKTITNMTWAIVPVSVDNGAASATADFGFLPSNSVTITFYKAGSATGWTTSGGKSASFTLTYEI